MAHFAVKRLAAVEIEPGASHQHELNAGTLRRGLGFPKGRTEGSLSVLCYSQPSGDPQVLEGSFTLYDAREDHLTRTEYRLYYRLPGFVEIARPDDLLVLNRQGGSGDLQGILARPGTDMEHHLEELLRVGDHASLRRLVVRTAAPSSARDAAELVQTLLPLPTTTSLVSASRHHPLFASAVAKAVIPPTKKMAQAGLEIAQTIWGDGLKSDEFVSGGLEAESELYFAIEREVGTRSLQALLDTGAANLDEMLSWALKIQQSRKSRRGQSLQHHFAFLLDREGIPYTAQCATERNEKPDFVIPGHAQYHDSAFPSDRLRMVACKSTVRERWGQILKEAERIPEKYLLTVDDNLSPDVVLSMREALLRVYLPRSIIETSYKDNPSVGMLGTVAELLDNLTIDL